MKDIIRKEETDWRTEYGVYAINRDSRLVENTSAVQNYTIELYTDEDESQVSDRLAQRLHDGNDYDYALYAKDLRLVGFVYYDEDNLKRLSDTDIKKLIAGEIIQMFNNNIMNEEGFEPFESWLEDGDVLKDMGMSLEDQNRAMALVRIINEELDHIGVVLNTVTR